MTKDLIIHATTGCQACKTLANKLREKNIDFIYDEDTDKTIALGEKLGMLGSPICEQADVFMTRAQVIEKYKL